MAATTGPGAYVWPMQRFPWEVVVLAVVLALNRLVVPGAVRRPPVFWGVQALNAALALGVVIFGVPGLEGYPAVSWLIAGLLAFHIVQNLTLRSRVLGEARRRADERELTRIAGDVTRLNEQLQGPNEAPPDEGDADQELGVPKRE